MHVAPRARDRRPLHMHALHPTGIAEKRGETGWPVLAMAAAFIVACGLGVASFAAAFDAVASTPDASGSANRAMGANSLRVRIVTGGAQRFRATGRADQAWLGQKACSLVTAQSIPPSS